MELIESSPKLQEDIEIRGIFSLPVRLRRSPGGVPQSNIYHVEA